MFTLPPSKSILITDIGTRRVSLAPKVRFEGGQWVASGWDLRIEDTLSGDVNAYGYALWTRARDAFIEESTAILGHITSDEAYAHSL